MTITGQWGDIRAGGKFTPDGPPVPLAFRETNRLYLVTFPHGFVKRCPKFDRFERPKSAWREAIYNRTGFPRCVRIVLIP